MTSHFAVDSPTNSRLARLLVAFAVAILFVGCRTQAQDQNASQGGDSELSINGAAPPLKNPPPPLDARSSNYLKGNASPPLPPGEPDKIAVIAKADKVENDILPVVVRNNTRETVIRIQIAANVRDGSGKLIASGEDQGFSPNMVNPGEIALGYVYFGIGSKLSSGDQLELIARATPLSEAQFENIRDIEITELNKVAQRAYGQDSFKIVGSVLNSQNETVTGPIGIDGMCFDNGGKPLSHVSAFAQPDTLQPSGISTFSIDLFKDCPVYLVSGSGFGSL